ncbi:hypothetical protein EDD11_001634 [Mortierella claussenii]|nr:hypothetical protein EDD11_001634 [Mortierella claussenii]
MTSGIMLLFHVITRPLSSSNSVDCSTDAEFAIIRWKPNNVANNNNYNNNNNNNNDDIELDLDKDVYSNDRDAGRLLSDNNIKLPVEVDSHQPFGSNNAQDASHLENEATDDTAPEEGEDDATEEEEEEEEQAPVPFYETLDQEDNVQYVTYLPYAGITNQFYGMLRGMEVAKALDRTLIIPPITASSHDKSKQNQPWSKFLDLERFQKLTGAKVIEFHKLRDAEQTQYNELECKITCGFGSKRTIDFTAKGFLKQWNFNVALTPLSVDANKLDSITRVLTPFHRDKFICISNTYKISVADKLEWDRFGQHLHFTEELEDFVQQYLDAHLVKPEPVYDPKSRQEITPKQKYIAIHVRRGDFAQYCQDNFAGPKMVHCFPTTEEIALRVDEIQSKHGSSTGSSTDIMPVFVATNERRPDELKKFADLGWTYLDHEQMGTANKLGVFGPMMVDQVFMAHAQALIGIQMSTFSRVGALRQRDWHQRQIEYM